jgi:two-component system, response regulator
MEYGKFKILLVDDDVDDAEMTMYTLRKLSSLNLHYIDDGQTALEYLFSDHNPEPSLILLDLKMPKVDGVQILRRLKADERKKQIPVVVLISSKEGKRYLESFNVQADSYLIKPVNCSNFLICLTEIGLTQGVGKMANHSGIF